MNDNKCIGNIQSEICQDLKAFCFAPGFLTGNFVDELYHGLYLSERKPNSTIPKPSALSNL